MCDADTAFKQFWGASNLYQAKLVKTHIGDNLECDNGSHAKKPFHHIQSTLSSRWSTHICQVGTSFNLMRASHCYQLDKKICRHKI